MFRFREAAIGNMLVHGAEVYRETIHDRNADPNSYFKTEAEVLSLGVGSARGVGEHEADPRFEVGDDRPAFLDEIIPRAKETTGEPWVGPVNDWPVHTAEKEFGVAPIPTLVADFIQLPTDGDELG